MKTTFLEFIGKRVPPDETSGRTILRTPMAATQTNTGGAQRPINLPKGTVVTLVKKLPQKRMVVINIEGKEFVASDDAWKKAVQL